METSINFDTILMAATFGGVFLLGWLFLGIFREREFRTHHLFLKHRPTFRFFFSFPNLQGKDPLDKTLTPQQQQRIHIYREYVEERGGSIRSIYVGF